MATGTGIDKNARFTHQNSPNVARLAMAIVFLLWASFSAEAQVDSGKIVGTVKDASGAIISAATVTVTETQTNAEEKIATNSAGEYVATELRPGIYTVKAERAGFKTAVEAPFKLDINQVVRVDFSLVVGSVQEQVVVTAAEPLVESETSSIGQVIDESRVHQLPLNGRDFIQLAYLSPGVNMGPASTGSTGNVPLSLVLGIACALGATAFVYLRGWLCLRSAFPKLISIWRLVAFMSGLVLVWTAVGSPLATLDHHSLTIHMMKHLLLMTVAAPLILAGAPAFPLVCGLPRVFIKSHRPRTSVPARWFKRCLRHPVWCWLAGTGAVIGWHLPVLFQSGMRSLGIHILQDLSFLVAGFFFWWPIMQSPASATKPPQWSMALYLFLATLPCDILSAFLVFCNRLVYPSYLSTSQVFSMAPLQDQECAGALMWVWVTFAYVIPAVAITVQILSRPNIESQGMRDARRRPAVRPLNGAEVR